MRQTDYESRCPNCGHKNNYIVKDSGEIICAKCKEIIGTVVNPELEVTILCSWNPVKK